MGVCPDSLRRKRVAEKMCTFLESRRIPSFSMFHLLRVICFVANMCQEKNNVNNIKNVLTLRHKKGWKNHPLVLMTTVVQIDIDTVKWND
jgi:hypothetical protein